MKRLLVLSLILLMAMAGGVMADDASDDPVVKEAGSAPEQDKKESVKPGRTQVMQLSILSPMQTVPPDESICGLRLGLLYTANKDVKGVSITWPGVNKVTGDVRGVELGIANWVDGSAYGVQFGAINRVGKRFKGLQYSLLNIVEGDTSGIQWGLVNWAEGLCEGAQVGVANISKFDFKGGAIGVVNYSDGFVNGFQGGFMNYAKEMCGFQLGVVNATGSLNGLQIGLVNYNGNKKPMEYTALVNWSF